MRVLLIEDDENKSREVESYLGTRGDVTALTVARSLHGGRKTLRSGDFDVVILDMTLPNYDATADEPGGGSVHSFGGQKLLRYMARLGVAAPTIVVTQFELFISADGPLDFQELDASLHELFGDRYLGMVYYHASRSRWRVDLGGFLDGAAIRQREAGESCES